MVRLIYALLPTVFIALGGCDHRQQTKNNTPLTNQLIMENKQVIDEFFNALETQQFEKLNDLFAEDARQLNPYVPKGFPTSIDGVEAIYKQYSGLPEIFGQMKFPREIYATEDPKLFVVKFTGAIEIKAGGTYENDYVGLFKVENGKIKEYIEYFNPIVMAKAFNLSLD